MLKRTAMIVAFLSVLLAFPAFFVPLGLSPEGDAVDYRIPLVQWIVRHHAFPNWPWAFVDDYPSLGELLMAALYSIHPNLVRLVPVFSFVGLGVVGGLLARHLGKSVAEKKSSRFQDDYQPDTLFWLGFVWTVSLRPLTLQANLLMVDNLASFFLLATVYLLLRRKIATAGYFAAGALATRYTTWATIAVLALAIPFLVRKKLRLRKFILFCFLAGFGAFPFMIRNFYLNGHPLYPLNDPEISKAFMAYGRGRDFLSFLIFPYDLLVTNTFIKGIYDYTVGKLFYIQLVLFGLALGKNWSMGKLGRLNNPPKGILVIALLHLLIWFFFGSQQLRFLVPSLVLVLIWLLVYLFQRENKLGVGLVTALAIFSAISIQKDSLQALFTGNLGTFEADRLQVERCKPLVPKEWILAVTAREGGLGFWNRDFVYLPPHPYRPKDAVVPEADFLLGNKPQGIFQEPFPKENPCGFKVVGK